MRLFWTAAVAWLAAACHGPLRGAPSPPAPATVRLAFTGDIHLGDASQPYIDRHGWDWPFAHLGSTVAGADLLIGNLETAVTAHDRPVSADKEYIYKMKPAGVAALRRFGFDLLCLANNHTVDYGERGLLDTLAALDAAGIGHFGAGADAARARGGHIVERGGVRFGFLGFCEPFAGYEALGFFAGDGKPGVAALRPGDVEQAIRTLRSKVDVVIVSYHWGRNYTGITEGQRTWGRQAVESGADLVVGHHPHVAQGVEVHRGVPIVHSLGNFVFGTPGRFRRVPELQRHGFVAHAVFEGGRLARLELVPIATDNRVVGYQPRPVDPALVAPILADVNAGLGPRMEIAGDRGVLRLERGRE